jgi:uncharacterized secreted repeat protein (TIGR03808 family)
MAASRRLFLTGLAGTLGLPLAGAQAASAASPAALAEARLRGAINASDEGLRPGAGDAQTALFQQMLDRASDRDEPIYLPAGDYVVSDVILPKRVRLAGVNGATRILFGGGNRFISAVGAEHLEIDGITIDGLGRDLGEGVEALLDVRDVRQVLLTRCIVTGSARHGLHLRNCGGAVDQCTISNAREAGLYGLDNAALMLTGNLVADCGNGGLWVHRTSTGDDGAQISGNRIERIGSTNGGTGQWGNGINAFQAGNVMIANNALSDCAFSGVRANSASNVQIIGNRCINSGETAIYAEFKFEGAVIASNLVDGAANGISVVNFNEGGRLAVVQGNLVRNLRETGPYAAEVAGFGHGIAIEADTTAVGNVIEGAPKAAFLVGWGEFMRNIVITGNVVRDTATGVKITIVEGSGRAVITDNVFEKIGDVAIAGYRWTEKTTGDLSKPGANLPANLVIARNSAA